MPCVPEDYTRQTTDPSLAADQSQQWGGRHSQQTPRPQPDSAQHQRQANSRVTSRGGMDLGSLRKARPNPDINMDLVQR